MRLKQWFILLSILLLSFSLQPSLLFAGIEEVHMGMDKGHLVAGGQFAVTDTLAVGLEYFEGYPLGWGLRYHTDRWQTEIINRARYWQLGLRSSPDIFFQIRENKEEEKLYSRGTVRFGNLHASGSLDATRALQELSGNLNLNYRWQTGRQSLRWNFYEDDEDFITLMLTQQLKILSSGNTTLMSQIGIKGQDVQTAGLTADHRWSKGAGQLQWQMDQFGESQELLTSQTFSSGEHLIEGKASTLIKEDEDPLYNFSFTHQQERNEHTIENILIFSQYDKAFIGTGIETLWSPGVNWLRLGTGLFSEETTGVSTGRYRLSLKDTLRYPFRRFVFSLTGGVEGFKYGTGEERIELSTGGGVAYRWDQGRANFRLQGVKRAGETPFDFDHMHHRFSLTGRGEIQQEIGPGFSRLTIGYNFIEEKWMVAEGRAEFAFFENFITSLTAAYDPENPPELDEITFILTLGYIGVPELRTRFFLNTDLSPLQITGQFNLPLASHKIQFDFDYDAKNEELNSLGLNFQLDKLGQVSFKMEPHTPKYMIHIQPIRW